MISSDILYESAISEWADWGVLFICFVLFSFSLHFILFLLLLRFILIFFCLVLFSFSTSFFIEDCMVTSDLPSRLFCIGIALDWTKSFTTFSYVMPFRTGISFFFLLRLKYVEFSGWRHLRASKFRSRRLQNNVYSVNSIHKHNFSGITELYHSR